MVQDDFIKKTSRDFIIEDMQIIEQAERYFELSRNEVQKLKRRIIKLEKQNKELLEINATRLSVMN